MGSWIAITKPLARSVTWQFLPERSGSWRRNCCLGHGHQRLVTRGSPNYQNTRDGDNTAIYQPALPTGKITVAYKNW